MPNTGIRNDEKYPLFIQKGYSKENEARIADTTDSGEKGGRVKPYNEWTKEELYQQARKVGIPGRSYMSKKNLITSLSKNQN